MSAPRPCPHCAGTGWDAGEPHSEVEIAGRRLDQYSWPEIDTMVVSLMDRLRVAQQSPDDEHPTIVSDGVEATKEELEEAVAWLESLVVPTSKTIEATYKLAARVLRREIERRG